MRTHSRSDKPRLTSPFMLSGWHARESYVAVAETFGSQREERGPEHLSRRKGVGSVAGRENEKRAKAFAVGHDTVPSHL